MNDAPEKSPRTQLVLIFAIALASLAGAYLLFYLAAGGAPWATTNHGSFVEPPLTVADAGVRTRAGAAFETEGLWWLWVVPAGPCDMACEEALHQLRQLHVLLNRDAARVRRALLTGGVNTAGQQTRSLVERYPRLEVLSGNLEVLEKGIYVVDPIGNLVFHYPLQDAGEPVLDDLERLLKVSQIG